MDDFGFLACFVFRSVCSTTAFRLQQKQGHESFLCASRRAPDVAAPLLCDCAQTFRFPADPSTFLIPYPLHVGVDSPDCSSDDSGAGLGIGAGSSADFLEWGCLEGAGADCFCTPLAPVPFLVA